MITAILAGLKLVPWRAIAAGMAVVAVALMGWRVSVWKQAHEALPGVRDALAREEACADGSKCYDRVAALSARQDEFNRQVAINYAQQLEEISNRPVPTVPVRLCRPARPSGVPGAKPPGAADGGAGSGDVPVEVGRDIAVELYRLADDADREALKLRWLQEWNRALSAPPARSPRPSP